MYLVYARQTKRRFHHGLNLVFIGAIGYINERTGSEFSHSVCPDCYKRVVIPEIEQLKSGKKS